MPIDWPKNESVLDMYSNVKKTTEENVSERLQSLFFLKSNVNRCNIVCFTCRINNLLNYRLVLSRRDAGLQLPPRKLYGSHLRAKLLQISSSHWAPQGMGYEQGISPCLHGKGKSSLKYQANDDPPFKTAYSAFFMYSFSAYLCSSPLWGLLVIYSMAVFQVHMGVRGYVKEAVNGAALINVSIVVAGIRHNLTTGNHGEYYRLLLPGTYNITAVAQGWIS